jgi:predicted transcriptional regulator
MDKTETILNVLKNSAMPLKSMDIATKTEIDKKEVDKELKNLLKEEKIHSPKRCFYSIGKE